MTSVRRGRRALQAYRVCQNRRCKRGDLFLDLRHRPPDVHRLLPARKHLAAGQVERRVLGMVAGQLQQPLSLMP